VSEKIRQNGILTPILKGISKNSESITSVADEATASNKVLKKSV